MFFWRELTDYKSGRSGDVFTLNFGKVWSFFNFFNFGKVLNFAEVLFFEVLFAEVLFAEVKFPQFSGDKI